VVYAKIKNKNTGEYALGIGTENTWSKLAIPVPANDGENIKWEAGKKYIYTLQFFKDGGGVGYVPPTPDGETPTGKEGQSAIPGNVHFNVAQTVSEWGEGSVEPEAPASDPNLLSGNFSVSATKKVKFTKGNLYWDGSDYKFETNQYDYPNTWDASHVGHFYWNTTDDITAGKYPYAATYTYGTRSADDKFFCCEDTKITVAGTQDLYVLTSDEWNYLITHNAKLFAQNVDGKKCLIIAPDGFTGTLQSSYTLAEVNSLGLLCLPTTGIRNNEDVSFTEGVLGYWLSLTSWDTHGIIATTAGTNSSQRKQAGAIRLVKTVE